MSSPSPLLCYTGACGRPAGYKISARWSVGINELLKTYDLCCPD